VFLYDRKTRGEKMKIKELQYNDWYTLLCSGCGTRHHTYEKPSKNNECTCGNTDLEIVELEDWKAGDFIQATTAELKKNGFEKYVCLLDGLYDGIKPLISSEELFTKVIRVASDEVYELMEG